MQLRNTPALLEEDFIAECKANGVFKVTQECFERTLQAFQADNGDENPLCALEVLEDYNNAYVFDGQYFMAVAITAKYALF